MPSTHLINVYYFVNACQCCCFYWIFLSQTCESHPKLVCLYVIQTLYIRSTPIYVTEVHDHYGDLSQLSLVWQSVFNSVYFYLMENTHCIWMKGLLWLFVYSDHIACWHLLKVKKTNLSMNRQHLLCMQFWSNTSHHDGNWVIYLFLAIGTTTI